MANKEDAVILKPHERQEVGKMILSGMPRVHKIRRAGALLEADESWTDGAVTEALDVGPSVVDRWSWDGKAHS